MDAGLNSKTPLLFVVITTVTGGGGLGVGVGLGVGEGVGRGVGEGVGRGKGVGDGVGRGADVGEGVGCTLVVAVGLALPVVGDAEMGVLSVLLVGLLELPAIAVGVELLPVLDEPPPQAATINTMPNNTKLNQIPG